MRNSTRPLSDDFDHYNCSAHKEARSAQGQIRPAPARERAIDKFRFLLRLLFPLPKTVQVEIKSPRMPRDDAPYSITLRCHNYKNVM